ncbi:hypothetical protein D3C85_1339740 [compost metagenome]
MVVVVLLEIRYQVFLDVLAHGATHFFMATLEIGFEGQRLFLGRVIRAPLLCKENVLIGVIATCRPPTPTLGAVGVDICAYYFVQRAWYLKHHLLVVLGIDAC